jgi:hypothetical protein
VSEIGKVIRFPGLTEGKMRLGGRKGATYQKYSDVYDDLRKRFPDIPDEVFGPIVNHGLTSLKKDEDWVAERLESWIKNYKN